MDAYLSVEGLLGVAFFLGCTVFVLFHIKKTKAFQSVDLSLLSIGLVYGLLFPVIVFGANEAAFPGSSFINMSSSILFAHTAAAVIASVGVYFGWVSVPRKKLVVYGSVFSSVNARGMLFSFYAMLVLSVVSMYLYTVDYGGFFGYFDYNRVIRSGVLDTSDLSRFSFLLPFGKFAVIACYGFWGLLLSKNKGVSVRLGFVSSFVVSVYVLLANSGRVSMVTFFAVFIISILMKNRIKPSTWFFGFFLMAVLGVFLLYATSNLLQINSAESVFIYVVREASFPFVSFFAQLNNGGLFHLFQEVVLAPAYLAPSSMTGEWLASATDVNTQIIMGARKGEGDVTGAIPVDLITFGLMQFHFFGVFVYATLFGFALRFATTVAGSFVFSGLNYTFIAYVMLNIGVFAVFYSYPKHILVGHFPVFVILLVFLFARRMKSFLVF